VDPKGSIKAVPNPVFRIRTEEGSESKSTRFKDKLNEGQSLSREHMSFKGSIKRRKSEEGGAGGEGRKVDSQLECFCIHLL